MRSPLHILGPLMLLALSSCATPEGALRPTTSQSIVIEGSSPCRITEATADVMKSLGYRPESTGNSQEPEFRPSSPSRPLRWIRGGNTIVSFILIPIAAGWNLMLVPEPDGVYPGPSATHFKNALESIRQKASEPTAPASHRS